MNERQTDFELLRDFARKGDQTAFTTVVRRHLDLVYATAVRKADDQGAAQEISQNVFAALARKAWQFAPDDSLPAWLYQATLLEAKEWLRGELRRRRREQTAAEMGTTMKSTDEQPALRALVPMLDEALLSLKEKDREALLLRFYENRQFRELGAALGVGEDAAQKRVASALEKLSRFFQRRGFKSAGTAAAAAALEQTATSVSASTAALVANAALQSAPPALTGLSALLANLAALTKTQTAVLCIAVVTVPLAWQWHQAHAARAEAATLRVQLNALQTQREQSVADLERMREAARRLEQAIANAPVLNARELEAARRLENLKARSQAWLADENYRWPDDLPFVRIPKSVVAAIRSAAGPASPIGLQSKVNEFLNLTPSERDAVSQIFSNYNTTIDELQATSFYETNRASSMTLPPEAESKVFVLEPMGEKIRAALDQLCAELAAALGNDRWEMVKPENFEFTHYEQVRLLGYTQYAWDKRQEVAVMIFPNANGEPTISVKSEGVGFSPVQLRLFLPGSRHRPNLQFSQGPKVFTTRVEQYVNAQAMARLGHP